ncbi:MAG: hypothetical protein KGD57_10670, partial [Candidatus Lokiarchaeota archaeon]|nr:hypothetical protein [Candidatus Lokiarchaeota archaeon]
MKRYNKVLLVNTFLLVFIIFTIPNINNPTSRGGIKTAATGDVWLSDVPELVIGETYDMYVYIDCEGYDLAAYGFDIEWDNSIVIVQGENAGVVEGDDGFIAAANVNNTAGIMRISGFDAMGVAGSSQFHMLTITWEAV